MAEYNLCPKCGAVNKDGICTTCGYKVPGFRPAQPKPAEPVINAQPAYTQQPQAGQPGQPGAGVFGGQGGAAGQVYATQQPQAGQPGQPGAGAFGGQPGAAGQPGMGAQAVSDHYYGNYGGTLNTDQHYSQATYGQQGQPGQPGAGAFGGQGGAGGNAYGQQPAGGNTNPYGQQFAGGNANNYGQQGYGTMYDNQAAYAQGYYNPNQYGQPAQPVPESGNGGKIALIASAVAVVFIVCICIIIGVTSKIRRQVAGYTGTSSSTFGSLNSIDDIDDDYLGSSSEERFGTLRRPLSGDIVDRMDDVAPGDWEAVPPSAYEDDMQYYFFADYCDTSVDYSIEEIDWAYKNTDGSYDTDFEIFPHDLIVTANCYRLSNTGLPNEDDINRRIYEKTCETIDVGEALLAKLNYDYYLTCDCHTYLTYNDNNTISFLFYIVGRAIEFSDTNASSPVIFGNYITSVNFDLTTGKEIKASETFEFGGDFYKTFLDKCLTQNGSPVDYYSDKDLQAVLTDDDRVVWAYTPLGLEVGVNRDNYDGWSTCTFLDYSDLLKVY